MKLRKTIEIRESDYPIIRGREGEGIRVTLPQHLKWDPICIIDPDDDNYLDDLWKFTSDNITEKWKVGFRSGYDLKNKDFTYTSIDIYRDLHCWEMTFNWIPIGFHQSYNFVIRVKSSILQDLKLTKKRDFYDY